ncbi:hypothetical protein JW948_11240 [bacterium]|nr:hypothetical protein [bacterium]
MIQNFGRIIVAAAVLALVYLVLFSPVPVNHDCAYLLQASDMLLRGAVPYVDYIGMNPPLIDYFHVLPVLVHLMFRISLILAFKIFILVLILFMTFIQWRLNLYSGLRTGFSRLALMLGYLGLSFLMLSWANFGQREHLFIVFFIPYLFLRCLRTGNRNAGTWIPVVLGVLSGIVFLFKPHFLIIVILSETWLCIRSKKPGLFLKPELLIWLGLGLVYALHFLFIPEAMRTAFFGRWLPFVAEHYDVYNRSGWALLLPFSLKKTAGVVLIYGLLYLCIRKYAAERTVTAEVWGIAAVTAHAVMVVQQKGWTYHRYPFIALGAFTLLVLLLILLEKWDRSRRKGDRAWHLTITRVSVLGLLLLKIVQASAACYRPHFAWMPQFVRLIREYSDEQDRVAVFSTSMIPAYPTLTYADRLPGTRYVTSFPIAMFYEGVKCRPDGSFPYRRPEDQPPEEKRFLKELGTDILNYKPRLIFVHADGRNQGAPWGFIIDDYLSEIGWMDRYLAGYTYFKAVDHYKVYRIRETH